MGRYIFKKNLRDTDYQRIIIEQNETIIQLLSLQTSTAFQGGLNTAILSTYKNALSEFIDSDLTKENSLSDSDKNRLEDLRRRKNVTKSKRTE